MNTDKQLRRLVGLAPSQWENTIEELLLNYRPSELGELTRAMESEAERLAYLAEYIEARSIYGHEHQSAAKVASRRMKKISKALGFTYPERRAISI